MMVLRCCLAILFLVGWAGFLAADDKANEFSRPGSSAAPPVTGIEQSELRSIDDAMRKLIADHEVPGAALAISCRGRLVYARGFGYGDVEAKQPVQPHARFRIASISKPITAVAVMRLVEQGRIKLEDPVFELLGLKIASDADARLNQVTIQDCLRHTGGWDRDKSFDPMFRSLQFAAELKTPPPAKAQDVIQCMLAIPLDFAPGQRYAYSNFGYCLLGRVIEKATARAYDDYVKSEVLRPLGIHRMQIGKTLPAGRAEDEVRYYDDSTGTAVFSELFGQEVPHPYGAWHLEAMDSHGGWIASAPDLVRFAAALDEPQRCSILKAGSIELMFARPRGLPGFDESGAPKAAYYACGWNVRPVGETGSRNTWHGGSLPGTSTWLVRRHDGVDWAVLFNRRDGRRGGRMSSHADQAINQAINQVQAWPDGDLFTAAK
jgi:N-acyl-D-amino-acid deacylase